MNLSDLARNSDALQGSLSRRGYMRWWHSFSGIQPETGASRTFFVEIFVVNPALGQNRPVLGQHPYFKKHGMKPSYVMVKAGAFPDTEGNGGIQLNAFYPISALQATGSPLVMRLEHPEAGRCLYSEDRLTGYVEVSPEEARHRSRMTDAGSMEWDVKVQKTVSCHTGRLAGKFFQLLNVLDSFWHGEGIKSFFQGKVILDGVSYEIIPGQSYGYADKHWGRCFSRPWFQFSCGKMTSQRTDGELRHSVLAVNSYRPKFFIFPFRPKFMLQLTYRGEDFEFTHCRWEAKETGKRFIWHILAQNGNIVVKISGSCTKKEMLDLQYEDPEGRKSKQPLWAGCGGVGTLQLYRRVHRQRELLDTIKLDNALCVYRDEASG